MPDSLLLLRADTLKISSPSITSVLEEPVPCNYSVPTLEKFLAGIFFLKKHIFFSAWERLAKNAL